MDCMIATSEPNAKQWLFTLMATLDHGIFVCTAVTLWAIWTARRKYIHEGITQSPQATSLFVSRFIRDLELINTKPQHTLQAAPWVNVAAHARPKAPPAGYVKIHVDGAVLRNRRGSAAAVCRDQAGNYMGTSALVLPGVTDPHTLEAIACREGHALAEDLVLGNLIIASDCKQVVHDIKLGN